MKIAKELLSVRIPKELNKKFSKHIAPLGISKNAFILSLIHKEISKDTTANTLENKNESAEQTTT